MIWGEKMARVGLPSKWLAVSAMAVFLGSSFLSIAVNSDVYGHGFDISSSISHYVGLEVWSAIFFTIANVFVAILLGNYLWRMGRAWRMPRVFYWMIVILVASLIGLSVCPSGMCDVGESPSIVTWVHVLTSRTMFFVMMLLAAMVVFCKHANTTAHAVNILFLMYAILCLVGFLTEDTWFMNAVMVYETMYLFGFMMAMALCDARKDDLLQD